MAVAPKWRAAMQCQRCKQQIPPERVEALPDTVVCVKCSKDIGGEYDLSVVADSMGKASSLKKNYGAFTLEKRRKRIKPLAE